MPASKVQPDLDALSSDSPNFCFMLVCLVIVSGFIGAPGAIILSIYYGNDGPNVPCSTEVPHWLYITGCVSIGMAGVPMLITIVMGLSSISESCANVGMRFLGIMGCGLTGLGCFMFGACT